MRRKSPVTVQQWIDSLPVDPKDQQSSASGESMLKQQSKPTVRGLLMRDASIQSDDTSNCSSVESMLELRKPDPEAVLLGLGFGPPKSTDYLSRIPQRFLQPSKVNGIDVGKFLQEQAELRLMESQLHFPNCAQLHSSQVSPVHSCDNAMKSTSKQSM